MVKNSQSWHKRGLKAVFCAILDAQLFDVSAPFSSSFMKYNCAVKYERPVRETIFGR